jgi:DNA topoisomerase III
MQVENAGSATVTAFSKEESRKQRPQGLNTVALLKIASSALNIGPQRAMQVPFHPFPRLQLPTRPFL